MTTVQVLDVHTREEAKDLFDQWAYYYLFEYADESNGRPLPPAEAAKMMFREQDILVYKAGYDGPVSPAVVDRAAKRHLRKLMDGRVAVAQNLFYDNLAALEIAKRHALVAIQNGNIEAVNQLVAVTKEQGKMAGYHAPQQIEFHQGQGDDRVFSDKDKERVKQLRAQLEAWEDGEAGEAADKAT